MVEQRGIHAGGRIIEIGDGFLDADAKNALPHAVRDGHGKARIVRRGHPLGELSAEVLLLLRLHALIGLFVFVVGPGDELGLHGIAGLAVGVFVIVREREVVLLSVLDGHGVHAEDVFGLLLHAAVVDAGEDLAHAFAIVARIAARAECLRRAEESGHFVELALRPVGEGMVVALRAGDIRAEEGAEREAQIIEAHARIAEEVAGGSVVEQLAIRGHHGGDHFVPGDVVVDLALQPVLIGVKSGLLRVVGHTQHIGEVIEEVAAVAFGVQQRIDDLRALGNAGVIDEGERLLACGDAAGEVEIHAADELLVAGERIGLLPGFGERAINELIDACGGLREIGVSRDAEAFGLELFGDLLILRSEAGERQTMHVAVADLEEDVFALDAAEGGLQLTPLDIGPGAIDLSFAVKAGGE